MKILDKYILKKLFLYLIIITPTFVFISLLIKIIEKFKNIKTFNFSDFFLYLIYTIPENLYYVLPIAVVLSVVLVYRDLVQTKKIYAVLTSGISVKRLSLVFFAFGFLASLLNLVNLEIFISPANRLATQAYEKLKKHQVPEEPLFIDNTWIKNDENTFVYIGFLDLKSLKGKNLTFIKLSPKTFKPIFRLEAKDFVIREKDFVLKNARIISVNNFPDINVVNLEKTTYPLSIDLRKLKKLVLLKKPVSLQELFRKAMVAERFGYPSAYFWSRFFAKLTTVFAPFVLTVLILPILWIKKKGKYIFVFVVIFLYWYLVSVLKALASSGSIPAYAPLFVNVLFVAAGLFLLKKLKFIEL